MTEKLKPCAYCQSSLELEWMSYEPYGEGGRWFVACTNEHCPAHFNDEDKDEVIRVWNTRPSCKDCKHFLEHKPTWCWKLDLGVNEDFYCAKFARKEK